MERPTVKGSGEESVDHTMNRTRTRRFAVAIAILAATAAYVLTTTALRAQTPGDRLSSGEQQVATAGSPAGIQAGQILVKFKSPPSQESLDQAGISFGARAAGTI